MFVGLNGWFNFFKNILNGKNFLVLVIVNFKVLEDFCLMYLDLVVKFLVIVDWRIGMVG